MIKVFLFYLVLVLVFNLIENAYYKLIGKQKKIYSYPVKYE